VIQDIAGTDAPSFIVYLASKLNTSTTIVGTDGNDFLMGNQSAVQGDYLHRTITGGKGNDVMWAGAMPGINGATNHYPYGANYKWNAGDAGTLGATDTIKDFRTSSVSGSPQLGDTLDFTGFLTGYSPGATLSNWIKSVTTGQTVNGVANSTVMVIDIDGASSGTVSQVVVLEGFDLLAGYSGNLANQLTALKNDGIIVV